MSEKQAIDGNERDLTEAQREIALRKPLTRFKRNRSMPAELEALRHKLIQARVMQGMMAIEAAEKFGYANSSQLSRKSSPAYVQRRATGSFFAKRRKSMLSRLTGCWA